MRLGFLGTGEITAALVRGLQGQGHTILVSPRNAARAAKLAELPGVAIASNEELVKRSEVVFLCLLARVADDVLPSLPFRAGQTVLSVMVDVPLDRLRACCAPSTDIAIIIGSPAIAHGNCPIPVYPASPSVDALFGATNLILPQDSENALNAHLGASALCSPILDQLIVSADWLASNIGDPIAAESYITSMIRALLPERACGGELEEALRKLSTEGGLNATLRAAMTPAKDSLRHGLDGFHTRLGLKDKTEGQR